LSTSSSPPSFADPFPSLSCRFVSPEMTGARQPTSAVRHERWRGSSGAVELGKVGCLDAGWHGEYVGAFISVGWVTGSEIRQLELSPLCAVTGKSGRPIGACAGGSGSRPWLLGHGDGLGRPNSHFRFYKLYFHYLFHSFECYLVNFISQAILI
jgi:hypothetical protein